jgi:hypothetical protein
MSRTKKILFAILIILVCIQFIRPARNQSGQVLATDVSNVVPLPGEVQAIFEAACYDCHSNNTRYPWYHNVQPIAWMLNNHIQRGKKELNLSEFGSYSSRRRESKLKSIASQVRDGEMPLTSYSLMHKDARLTKDQKALLINWAQKTIETLK